MAAKKETQEIAVAEQRALAIPTEFDSAWDTDAVEAKDIRIPRALLMQSMSDLVGERKAAAGDVVNSITGAKLADDKSPLQVIPIHTFKTWAIHEKINGKFEFRRSEDYTPINANRKREETVNGIETQNVETINLLCLQASEVAKPDALPLLISFRMTSYACGKDILTLKVNCARINKPLPFYTATLTPVYTKNDKGQFFVWKYSGATPTQDFAQHAPVLKGWFDTFKAGQAQVDTEVEPMAAPTGPQAGDKF